MTDHNRQAENLRAKVGQYVLIAVLACGIAPVYWPVAATTRGGGIALRDFPMRLGDWSATDLSLVDEELKTLGATEYLLREYRRGNEVLTVYITYFDTGHGALTHNPEKCFTASGWTFLDKKKVAVPGTGRFALQSTIARGDSRQVTIYWYQESKTVIVSKWSQIARVLSKAMTGRPTYSLVASVSRSLDGGGNVEITDDDVQFVRAVMEALAQRIPSQAGTSNG